MLGRREGDIGEYVPFVRVVPDGRADTVVTRAGGMMAVIRVEWPDLDTMSPEQMVGHGGQLLLATSRLGDGFTIYYDLWRWPARAYLPPSDFGGCLAAAAADGSMRRRFEPDPDGPAAATRARAFRNTTFVALHYLPPAGTTLRARLYEEEMRTGDGPLMQRFRHGFATFTGELRSATGLMERQAGDQLASYLLATTAYRKQDCEMPAGALPRQLRPGAVWNAPWVAIDARLEGGRLVGGTHLATVDVHTPGSAHPLTFQECYGFDFPLRWVTRLDCVSADRQPAVIERKRRPLESTRMRVLAAVTRSWGKRRGQSLSKEEGDTKPEKDKAIAELAEYRERLAEDPLTYATVLVQVPAPTREEALRNAQLVAGELGTAGVACNVTTIGRWPAYLSCIPGNVSEARRYPRRVELPTANALRAAPIMGTSGGHPRDLRFEGRALFRAETRSGVPYDFVLNLPGRDVGHFVVIGQTGAGKSTLLALIALMFLVYEGARVVIFDKKRSSMVAVLCAGGVWIELAPGRPGVQPLRHVDRPEDRGWAAGWIERAIELQGKRPTAATAEAVSDALEVLAREPDRDQRTLTEFWGLVCDEEVRQALKPYLRGGVFGGFFDGVVPSYGAAPILGIETDLLDSLGRHAPLAMGAVFWHVKRHWLAGPGPKLVLLDEAWASLRAGSGSEREFESGVREGRKGQTVYGLATQFVADMDTDLARPVMAQVETRFYLPDGHAKSETFAEHYRRAGLTPHQLWQLSKDAKAKRDYLYQATNGETRLLRLPLEGAALAICGVSSVHDQERARELLEAGVERGERFTLAWLAETTGEWRKRRGAALRVAAE